jgi:hypothetical protein
MPSRMCCGPIRITSPSLPGIQQEPHRETRPRANRTLNFELCDLGFRPRMNAPCFCLDALYTGGRVVFVQADCGREFRQSAQGLEVVVRSEGFCLPRIATTCSRISVAIRLPPWSARKRSSTARRILRVLSARARNLLWV